MLHQFSLKHGEYLIYNFTMGHDHNHSKPLNYSRAFLVGIILNLTYIAVEVIYGLIANSSALLADAGHNASDVLGLVFAWFAIWLANKKPKGRYSYGFKKSTILISVLNALLLFTAVFIIGWDAIGKFKNPEPVAGSQVMIVAGIGVIINTLTALMFIKGQKDDLNIRGAFLHMAADAAVSLGVVIAGLLILKTGLQWIDPIMSFLIIGVIIWGTWKLFIDSVNLALDAVPKQINIDQVREHILAMQSIEGIHDLHIWAMSTTQIALTAHIKLKKKEDDDFIPTLKEMLHKEFNIDHTTFQLEYFSKDIDCDINC